MKHFALRILGLAVLGLLLTTGLYAGTVDLVITQNSFVTYGPGNAPIGPYTGTLNGVPNLFSCLDLFKTTYVGVVYPGTLMAASTVAEKEAVWLTDQEFQLLSLSFSTSNDTATFGDLNFAIWNIIDPTVDISSLPGAQAYVAGAASFLAAHPLWVPDHLIFTPDDTSAQSFAVVGSSVPEPGSLMLLGSGAIALAGVLRRRLKT